MILWVLIRAAGIGGYIALFLSVAWGLVSSTGVITKRMSKPSSNRFHASVASVGLALLAIHMILLLFHDFVPFQVLDLLVPMRSTFRPIAITLGVIAMYAAVIVTVSSWLRGRFPTKTWRALHLLAIPAFILALLHGVLAGTDTNRPWMVLLYAGTALVTLFLVIVRGLTVGYRQPRASEATRATQQGSAAA
ncbi:MAG: ferric reductase-like transmembrane domain-containing protein [Actinomycetota bacterium]